MTTLLLDPLISEFNTQQEADEYDAWFRAKVQAALDDPSPLIPHDEVVAHFAQKRAERLAKLAERNHVAD